MTTSKPGPAEASTPGAVPRRRPERMCDVVMKGGIASGVVYPRAITEIGATYRLKNVGGTSAGAIAAAVAAAAEYGRTSPTGGFARLEELPDELSADGRLKSLFQPQRGTRGLYALALGALGLSGRSKPVQLGLSVALILRRFPGWALIGAIPGAILLGLALIAGPTQAVSLVAGALVLLAGMVVGAGWRAYACAQSAIPANGYGLCSGMPGHRSTSVALTPWLSDVIDRAAGFPVPTDPLAERPVPPLTFGQLWGGPGCRPASIPDDAWLRLEMMTTNVTNHRAEKLPMGSREYYFDPDEFRRLFPGHVVDAMLPKQEPGTERSERNLRLAMLAPLIPMPEAADLPVIVATRMSLSFPVLLSAVPLWRIDFSRIHNGEAQAALEAKVAGWNEDDGDWEHYLDTIRARPHTGRPRTDRLYAERCWFSDGGISSNFPVQFFDSHLPRHPTFAINLRPFAPDDAPTGDTPPNPPQRKHVWTAKSNSDQIADSWFRFDDDLPAFLGNIVRTMQNRVDEAQMRLPGYRDRIAHVSLTKHEGGLNLDMDSCVIDALTERGQAAGQQLVERFGGDPSVVEMSWDNHRWIRLRTTLAATVDLLRQVTERYQEIPADDDRQPSLHATYADLLNRPPGSAPRSYALRSADRVQEAIALLTDLTAALPPATSVPLSRGAPAPRTALRPSPQEAAIRARTLPQAEAEEDEA